MNGITWIHVAGGMIALVQPMRGSPILFVLALTPILMLVWLTPVRCSGLMGRPKSRDRVA